MKETYNTCAMALSEEARRAATPVILAGEGADELYTGYRFDQSRLSRAHESDLDAILEEEIREVLWGDAGLFYEPGFQLHAHLETDLLMVVLSTGILIDTFGLPALGETRAVALPLGISEQIDAELAGRSVEPSTELGAWE